MADVKKADVKDIKKADAKKLPVTVSRVGKLPIVVPSDVKVDVTAQEIKVKGKLGELSIKKTDDVDVYLEGGKIIIKPNNGSIHARAMWGTMRSILNNMVKGVAHGFSKRIEIKGVGYKAQADNKLLSLSLGFSHEIKYAIPQGIHIKCEKPTLIVISGADKQQVGQVAGELKKLRPVEPYKGKGVFEEGAYIRRKEGKKK